MVLVAALAAGCEGPGFTISTITHPQTTLPAGAATTTPAPLATSSPATAPTMVVIPQAARDALATMTLRAKAAQVLLVAFDGTTLTDATRAGFASGAPGGVLLLGRNVAGESQLRRLTAALQQAAASSGSPGLFVAADEEGGQVMRVKAGVPAVPAARVLGTTGSATQAGALAGKTAAGLMGQGVNMVLGPVADVVADKGSFLFARSFGDQPATVSDFAASVTAGFRDRGIVTVVKHFPGHGSAPDDSHISAPVSTASRAEFESVHLPPFRAAIAAGADGVMVGHFVAPAFDPLHPASQSAAIIEDLLRGELQFRGLVVSDDLEMAAATGHAGDIGTASPAELGEAAVGCLAAGCDLLITTGTYARQQAIEQAIVDAVGTGKLSRERLDEAVGRVLAAKLAHGLPLPARPAGPQDSPAGG